MDIGTLVATLAALAGVGALIAVLVNIGKTAGLVKDGQATTYVAGLNLLALIGLFALKVFKPDFDIGGLDTQAAQIAQWLATAVALIVQIYGSKWAYGALKGVPVVGRANTVG